MSDVENQHTGSGDDDARTAYRDRFRVELDRHSTGFRADFVQLSDRLHATAPIAWTDTHGGYWFVNGNQELFDVARRADVLSNDNDIRGERRGYWGVQIPPSPRDDGHQTIAGFLEMDPPVQRYYRNALNPYLSPAAIARWQPVQDEITRACLDEVIGTGRIDVVDDLANVVPAVLTMAMLGLPLESWTLYSEPIHAQVYMRPEDPDMARIQDLTMQMAMSLFGSVAEIRTTPRPGLIDALIRADIGGRSPDDLEVVGAVLLLIGGGFDTTTALTAKSLEWLSQHPASRDRLIRDWDELRDSATEEFLRYFSPLQGDGRTVARDAEIDGVRLAEGERLWLSFAMANRDAAVFEQPHAVELDRKGNRHASFGLGVHRCIGSNLARATFKTMVKAVLDRMPDFVCDPAGAVHYDSTGTINGMRHLPATFTPGERRGPGLAETIARLQRVVDEQRLAEPVTTRPGRTQAG
ncbi:cytochrome P450 [Trujillonella endophytica]|uniref:Cytochrome P450 n=1 Tax=Trujillonella endophytica TaxID=673521 RepID=A0A1H8PG20_9ACTN|nr:cytochrome P450 [Trujillella endophytica]SEO40939.1 Cytochrome P450 [Trujillella endophytica]